MSGGTFSISATPRASAIMRRDMQWTEPQQDGGALRPRASLPSLPSNPGVLSRVVPVERP
eukprot:SAG11_NODE_32615_length_282_cov_0.841530_1_plen_59_part_01